MEDIKTRIEAALDNIRPYLEADGGNVKLIEVTPDMIVRLELEGACASCNMSAMTMKAGVQDAIMRAIPEVKSVEAINMMVIV